MPELQVAALGVEPEHRQPLLLLREIAGERRLLPIWIGVPEAQAIVAECAGTQSPRPLTHQLLADVVTVFNRRLERVVLTGIHQGQYHADLRFDAGSVVSARASDAVVIGLRLRVPIHADESVLDLAGISEAHIIDLDGSSTWVGGTPDDQIREFRKFLDDVSPEEFGSG